LEFDFEPQDLMKFGRNAPYCTWVTNHLMRGIWSFKFLESLDLLYEFDLNLIKILTLVYLELGLTT
jgi:hypothetical protein